MLYFYAQLIIIFTVAFVYSILLNILSKLYNVETLLKTLVKSRVARVYSLLRKSTGALGGNGSGGAIYGELTMHSMQKVRSLQA